MHSMHSLHVCATELQLTFKNYDFGLKIVGFLAVFGLVEVVVF